MTASSTPSAAPNGVSILLPALQYGAIGSVVYGATAPNDGNTWFQCNGQSVSQSVYSALYGAIGHNYLAYSLSVSSQIVLDINNASQWAVFAYDGTAFVGVADVTSHNPTDAVSSTDGLTWNEHSAVLPAGLNAPQIWSDGNGTVLAYDTTNTNAARTTNHGVTWTAVTLPTSGVLSIGNYGANLVAVLPGSTAIYYSANGGATWATSSSTLPTALGTISGVWYDTVNSVWRILGNTSTGVAYLITSAVANGQTGWTGTHSLAYITNGIPAATSPLNEDGFGLDYTMAAADNVVVCAGALGTSESYYLYSNTGGASFTQIVPPGAIGYGYGNSPRWNGLHFIDLAARGNPNVPFYSAFGDAYIAISASGFAVAHQPLTRSGNATTYAGGVTAPQNPYCMNNLSYFGCADRVGHRLLYWFVQDLGDGNGPAYRSWVVQPAVNVATQFCVPNFSASPLPGLGTATGWIRAA